VRAQQGGDTQGVDAVIAFIRGRRRQDLNFYSHVSNDFVPGCNGFVQGEAITSYKPNMVMIISVSSERRTVSSDMRL
jgi:hypothetical protein